MLSKEKEATSRRAKRTSLMSFGGLFDMPYGSSAALPAGAISHPPLLSPSLHKSIFSSPGLSLALVTHRFLSPSLSRIVRFLGAVLVSFRSKRTWTRTGIETWSPPSEETEKTWIRLVGESKMRTIADQGAIIWKADLKTIWS